MNHLSIHINNLHFRDSDNRIADDIDLDMSGGETALIIGPTGSGKSSLLNCMNGLIPGLINAGYDGEILWNGAPLYQNSGNGTNPSVYTVLQNVYHTHAGYFFRNLDEGYSGIKEESMMDNLKGVEIFQDMSAGMKQRFVLQNAFQSEPRILLLDEPSNHLDEQGRLELLELLKMRKKNKQLLTIITEHEGGAFDALADKVLKLRSRAADDEWNTADGDLLRINEYLDAPVIGNNGNLIQFSDVLLKYNDHTVLERINLRLNKGEVVGITGENGSGKTTLGKAILGYKKPSSGKITRISRKLRMSVLAESPQFLCDKVVDEISFPVQNFNSRPGFVDALAHDFNLDSKLTDSLDHLSYGTQVRLALSSALAGNPDLIVLDEPIQGQDYRGIELFKIIVQALRNKGKAVVVFSQNMDFIASVADRQLKISNHQLAVLN